MKLPQLPLGTRAAVLYVLIGAIWIALSDRLAAALFPSAADLTIVQTYKGWFFVLGSGLFLLIYIGRESKVRLNAQKEFARVFGQALEGIFHASPDGKFLKVNPALARMYGYDSPEDLLAAAPDMANQIHVEAMMFAQFRNNLLRNDRVENFEAQQRRKDGTVFWTSTTARTVRNRAGAVSYVEGFVTDITSHKASETALLEHEQQYRMLFESAPIGIGVIDLEGRILEFNDAVLEPGGYTREDIEQLNSADQL